MENEIILYQPDSSISLEVKVEDETVWLTQSQMTDLFQATKQNISLHINNIFKEGELDKNSVVKDYLTVQKEGNRSIKRKLSYYNLDVIISVGYRVRSQRGTDFRIWATKTLREYLLKGYVVNDRLTRLENTVAKQGEKIEMLVNSSLPPTEGIFFEGEVFDAYDWLNKRITSAEKRIIIMDPYADYTVFQQLNRRKEDVNVTLYTSTKNDLINLDLKKFNKQYPNSKIELHKNYTGHDRFLIIDDTVYHVGGSMKDLGNRLMAYSILHMVTPEELIAKIG